MFKVNTQNLTAERGNAPKEMRGLGVESLRNLQTVLTTQQLIDTDHVNIEYWPDTVVEQSIEPSQKFGDEVSELDLDNKTILVSLSVLDKTAEELEEDRKASIPSVITKHQAMVALRKAGKKQQIRDFLKADGNEDANDAFDYKTHFNRGSEFISALAPALGMTDLDVDNLFLAASLID